MQGTAHSVWVSAPLAGQVGERSCPGIPGSLVNPSLRRCMLTSSQGTPGPVSGFLPNRHIDHCISQPCSGGSR